MLIGYVSDERHVALSGVAVKFKHNGSDPATPSLLSFPGYVHDGDVSFDDEITIAEFDDPAYHEPDRESGWETAWVHLRNEATVRALEGYDLVFPPRGVPIRRRVRNECEGQGPTQRIAQ